METVNTPRSEATLRPTPSAAASRGAFGGRAGLLSMWTGRVEWLLVALALAVGAAAAGTGWSPWATGVAAASWVLLAIAALGSTIAEARAGTQGTTIKSPAVRGSGPHIARPPAPDPEGLVDEVSVVDASDGNESPGYASDSLSPVRGHGWVGTREAPLAVLVVRMIRPDATTLDALSRVHQWSPMKLVPTSTSRLDEKVFVTPERAFAQSPQALLAHLSALSPGILDTVRIGVALTPDDGSFDQAQLLASQSASLASPGEVIWHDPVSSRMFARGGLAVGELRDALRSGQLTNRFQPIYDHHGRALLGAELLVTWDHPECGPLTPARFLPRFQARPEFADLTQDVFALACRKVAAWEGRFGGRFQLVINAGVTDLCSPATFGVVAHLLHHVGAGRVWVDVDIDELLAATDAQRDMLIAHGDVGLELLATSYRASSQLDDLDGLPVVGVKIDVDRLGTAGWVQVTELARVAATRGFDVHAVRVGTAQDLAHVRRIPEIGFLQGYALSEPVDERTMDAIAAERAEPRSRPHTRA